MGVFLEKLLLEENVLYINVFSSAVEMSWGDRNGGLMWAWAEISLGRNVQGLKWAEHGEI